jgi:hypothetical protein
MESDGLKIVQAGLGKFYWNFEKYHIDTVKPRVAQLVIFWYKEIKKKVSTYKKINLSVFKTSNNDKID